MIEKPKRCRHRTIWLYRFGAAQLLWCYRCGAIRTEDRWTRPTGPGGENPAMKTIKNPEQEEP